jgi:hypothetical protein
MENRRVDWAHGVDENLASLNSGQRVNDRLIEDLELTVDKLASLLHGEDDSGFIGRLESIEDNVAQLRAVIFQDSTGHRGLLEDVKALKEAREDRRMDRGNLTKIVVAAIMSGVITHFWQDIRSFLNHKSTDPVDQMIEKAEHPKARHRRVVIREEPQEPEAEN